MAVGPAPTRPPGGRDRLFGRQGSVGLGTDDDDAKGEGGRMIEGTAKNGSSVLFFFLKKKRGRGAPRLCEGVTVSLDRVRARSPRRIGSPQIFSARFVREAICGGHKNHDPLTRNQLVANRPAYGPPTAPHDVAGATKEKKETRVDNNRGEKKDAGSKNSTRPHGRRPMAGTDRTVHWSHDDGHYDYPWEHPPEPRPVPWELPIELWDHILGLVDDDRDLAAVAAASRLLRTASKRPRRRLAQVRWGAARAHMDAAVDAWEVETAIEWRPRYQNQECQSDVHDQDGTWPLGTWACDDGLPDRPHVEMACDACVDDATRRWGEAGQRRWPRRRIDLSLPHVGAFDHRRYTVCHWLLSHRLADGVDFVVPPGLCAWADPVAAVALADRWSRPARYGATADSDQRPLQGMLVLVGLASSEMGSVRGWLPVAWRRVRIALPDSGRLLWGAQFVLVCCDRASPLWGVGALVEQNSMLAMGRWTRVADDLAATLYEWRRSTRGSPSLWQGRACEAADTDRQNTGSSVHCYADAASCPVPPLASLARATTTAHVPGAMGQGGGGRDGDDDNNAKLKGRDYRPDQRTRRAFVAWLWETRAAPANARHIARDGEHTAVIERVMTERATRVITLRAADEDAPVETPSDDDDGAFWHCPTWNSPFNRRRVVCRLSRHGRAGLFW